MGHASGDTGIFIEDWPQALSLTCADLGFRTDYRFVSNREARMKPCGYGLGMSGRRSCAIPRGVLPPSARARPISTPPFTRRAAADIRTDTDAVRSLYLYSKRNNNNQQSSCRAREYASAPFSPPDNAVAAAVMADVLAWDWRCSTSRWVYHLTVSQTVFGSSLPSMR